MSTAHEPVMVAEVLDLLQPSRGGLFVDCTAGLGGHARAVLDAGATRLIGLDRDLSALALAREALAAFGDRVELVHADYRELDRVLDERAIEGAAGILADLGVEKVRLLTNNTDKVAQLREFGLDIVEQVPLLVGVGPNNHQYLATKRDRMGHLIDADDLADALAQMHEGAER